MRGTQKRMERERVAGKERKERRESRGIVSQRKQGNEYRGREQRQRQRQRGGMIEGRRKVKTKSFDLLILGSWPYYIISIFYLFKTEIWCLLLE